ncbi:alpha/beta fold hydrolase [Pseudomonas viridiflava]|uniref:Alpha/beta fold hydrolase n=1 Tax=Pseudomonas viridiflava TaxID=33069 RepID=A0ABU7N0X0_PSEVI|nr:alpha/beta fold hydrolase [Pseudomonas viridiflava]MCJ8176634.1 alpha/beta fold hydrolase [Pseudomonas viridiflava]MEE3934210.1 alpha/beta fold hydrolase [Pseudomonas viridiflava]MEE4038533.1 alpha/beta fold hydrolase [Pseudomonas viridiflava]MEE4058515.1 alpha/beta fold hydrolase [Pseudomonas viridiflava]MEE4167566.1 alpha/beta fold hydrolase [Pseudomonas viridiflava]
MNHISCNLTEAEKGQPVTTDPVTLVAEDGYQLSATLYKAQGPCKGNVIMAGATGVKQAFYRRFAEHSARQGFNVLTLDYRGVGASGPASLKGFEMSILDWGMRDLAAAVDYMEDGKTDLFWVGHSFGGQGLGLLPNHHKIRAAYCFGIGSGWTGWMSTLESLKLRLLWFVILPPIVAIKGYMAWSILGMGDDLPLSVFKEWRRWCSFPHYFFDDPTMSTSVRRFAEVRTPCVFVNSVDDPWATFKSRDAFIKGYSGAPLQTRDLYPDSGKPIGHMGYFRASAYPEWDRMLDWFKTHNASTVSDPII